MNRNERYILTIDGAMGEGGGQILRSALSLSLCLARPFRIENIRAGRKKPGLMRQHLTAIRAAAEISDATVTGAAIGSQSLGFEPRQVRPGEFKFAVGTAGSVTLVLQTVLLPLVIAGGHSRLALEGGTHNPYAPPFDYIEQTFLPAIRRMGAVVEAKLMRPGFYPAGGGKMEVEIGNAPKLAPVSIMERGPVTSRRATVIIAGLPEDIARRELKVLEQKLNWEPSCFDIRTLPERYGPGNVIAVSVTCGQATEVFTGFGVRGVRAEKVAGDVVEEVRRYISKDVPVGEHLADQLLLPMALAGAGEFITSFPSKHTKTNMAIIEAFTGRKFGLEEMGEGRYRIFLN